MKPLNFFVAVSITLTLLSCKKNEATQLVIPIPNGDFEFWDGQPTLLTWLTNSCPLCVPPYETYIVKKVTEVANGQFAAKFTYNGVYSSSANNKFSISLHPTVLIGYIKSSISNDDTATIHVDIFSGNNIVDNGNYIETSSTLTYKKIAIPISQTSSAADSALIKIVGGKKGTTTLYVDNLVLIEDN